MTATTSDRVRQQSVFAEGRHIPAAGPSLTLLSTCVALALASTLLPIQSAVAQQQPAQQSGLEEITVTGSRIHQNQDYASPNPISTIDAQEMENLGHRQHLGRHDADAAERVAVQAATRAAARSSSARHSRTCAA